MNPTDSERLELAVYDALQAMVPRGATVLLAVSGGSDSLGLMHLMAAIAPKLSLKLQVACVNHGLREGVDAECRLVEQGASSLNLPVTRLRVSEDDVAKVGRGVSVQEWARDVRYMLLEELALRVEASHIATGHTLDDQAETMLLRLLRGTGLDGLVGMAGARRLEHATVIRPLLGLEREAIQEYLRLRQISWVSDPSNENQRFLRVRVRRELLPLMNQLQSGIPRRLAQLTDELRAVVSYLDSQMGHSGIVKLRLAGGVLIRRSTFEQFPRSLWGRLVRGAIRAAAGNLRRVERVHVEAIEEQLDGEKVSGEMALPGTTVAFASRGSLFVFPKLPAAVISEAKRERTKNPTKYVASLESMGVHVAAASLGDEPLPPLELRFRREGDLSWESKHTFKKHLQNQKIPLPYRGVWPVLTVLDQVIASPLVLESRHPQVDVSWTIEPTSPLIDLDDEVL